MPVVASAQTTRSRRRPAKPADVPPLPALSASTSRLEDAQVAQRAYELFLARGGAHGQDLDDWIRAERELTSLS